MSLEPLFAASPVVFWHAVAALAALPLGVLQLVGPKGTAAHRVFGWAWVLLMLSVAVSSFGIGEIGHWRGFSLIHLLSIVTLVSVPLAVLAARTGRVEAHRKAVTRLFWLALVGAGAFTLLPGRIMGGVVFGW